MAKTIKKEKVPHDHIWTVHVKKEKAWHCNCESEGDIVPRYAEAYCPCGEVLEQYQIENILNKRV